MALLSLSASSSEIDRPPDNRSDELAQRHYATLNSGSRSSSRNACAQADLMAEESVDHRKSCGQESHSLHDALEPQTISAPCGFRKAYDWRLGGESRRHAVPDDG